MAVGVASLACTGDTTDGTSWTTPSMTFTAGRIYLFSIVSGRSDSVNASTATLAGAGLTWTKIAENVYDQGGGSRAAQTTFACTAVASTTSGACTITTPATHDGVAWSVLEVTNGGAVVQAVTAGGAGGSDTSGLATLAALQNANSMCIGFLCHSTAEDFNVGSGFTKANSFFAWATPSQQIGAEYKINDTTVDASWSSAGRYSMTAIEISLQAAITPSGSITPTGTLYKAPKKLFSGSITPTGTFSALRGITLALAGSITPTGALFKSAAKVFSGSITPTGSLSVSRLRKLLYAAVSNVLSLTLRSSEDTLTLTPESDDTLHLTELDEENA